MRATTIRFPGDLWEQLEREAGKQGISVAQYVRDAALYRVAGDEPVDLQERLVLRAAHAGFSATRWSFR